jgi:hypothetical protein
MSTTMEKPLKIGLSSESLCIACARGAAALTCFIGVSGVIGWVLNVEILARPSPWLAPMSTITAVLLCLTGVAVAVSTGAKDGRARTAVAALGAVIAAAGAWSFVGYLCQLQVPFDNWLLDRRLAAGLANGLNRMSPASALCFALFGAASVLSSVRGNRTEIGRASCRERV